ncbi:fused 2-acylglycerophospho-ethanolamine acyltransferase/acyl-acyl carrier protein synthetase [Gammaproteobacteria bacterium]
MFQASLRPVLTFLIQRLFRLRIEGDLSVLSSPRLLVVANHQSFLDGLLIGLYLPIQPVFVVHTTVLANPLFRWILGQVEHLGIDPLNPMALKKVVRLVEEGRPVVIFPEGRITLTGNLMKIYDGPAMVAARTGATVVPIVISGAAHSYFGRLPQNFPRAFFPPIRLRICPATRIPMPEAGSAKVRRHKAGETLRRLMQAAVYRACPHTTLFGALRNAQAVFGRRGAVAGDIRVGAYTYRDLVKMALALGRLGSKHSVEGERVGILLPNLVSTIGLILGLTAFRRVPALLNYTAGTEGMQNACRVATLQTIITSRAFLEQARLHDKVSALQGVRILYLEDLRGQFGWKDKLWLMGFALWKPDCALPAGCPEDPAVVLFTSGSEGKPKGVVLSHRALLANVAQIRAVVDINLDDRMLNALPIFHAFGLTGGSLLPLLSGASLYLYPSPLHYRVIPELAYDQQSTLLLGTSTFLGNYARFAHSYDFHRLRYVIAGAEKLAEPVRRLWMEKFGMRILEGYGATETAPVLAVNTPMAYRSGTVGELLPGVEARLIPAPGIHPGGILHVRGDNLMSGYLRVDAPGVLEPPRSEAGEGWYDTGDVAEFTEEGFLRLLGRIKRFAKVAGEMVSLEMVEGLAYAVSPDAQHGATSQPDRVRGEAILLFTTDPALTRDRLQAAAQAAGQPEIAVPRKIQHLPALPLLGTGKVDHVTLRTLAQTA